MQSLWSYIKSEETRLSVIIIFFAIVCFGISIFVEEFSNRVISFMFIMVALQNFLIQTKYLEKIKKAVNAKKQIKLREDCCSFDEIINNAEHSFLISGFTLSCWIGTFSKISSRADNGLKVQLLVTDPALLNVYESMRGSPLAIKTLEHLVNLKKNANIEIRLSKSILPTTFIATDIEHLSGSIRVQHLVKGFASKDYPNLELRITDDWYDKYKLFLEDNWEKALPWDPSLHDNVSTSEKTLTGSAN